MLPEPGLGLRHTLSPPHGPAFFLLTADLHSWLRQASWKVEDARPGTWAQSHSPVPRREARPCSQLQFQIPRKGSPIGPDVLSLPSVSAPNPLLSERSGGAPLAGSFLLCLLIVLLNLLATCAHPKFCEAEFLGSSLEDEDEMEGRTGIHIPNLSQQLMAQSVPNGLFRWALKSGKNEQIQLAPLVSQWHLRPLDKLQYELEFEL